MTKTLTLLAGTAAITLLAGCVEDTGSAGILSPEAACRNATIAETGTSEVGVGRSTLRRDGTVEVILAVGPQQAAWQCIAFPNGGTSRPMSLTNEGSL